MHTLAVILCIFTINNLNAQKLESYNSGPLIVSEDSLKSDRSTFAQSADFDALYRALPNMFSSKGSNRTKFLQIRGVGERSEFTPLLKRSVGVSLDGIDYTDFPQAFDNFGINRKSISYGPQIDGPIAGSLIFKEEKILEKKVTAQILYSSFNHTEQKATLSTGDNKILPLQLNISKVDSDGHYHNDYLNRKNTNERDEFYLRVKTYYQLNSQFKLTYRFHLADQNNGYDAFVQNNSYKTQSDKPGSDDLRHSVHQFNVEKDGELAKNKFTVEYMNAKSDYSYDEDWGNNQQWQNLTGFNSNYDYDREFLRERKRYTINHKVKFNNASITTTYKSIKDNHTERGFKNGLENDLTLTKISDNSLISSLSKNWILSDNFSLITEFGLERSELKMKNNFSFNKRQQEILSRARITLDHDQYYISLSKGSKAGGFNTGTLLTDDRKVYQSEDLYSLDIGTKYFSYKKNISNHLNIFVTRREKVQVKTSYQADSSNPGTFTFYNDNATDGLIYGLENKFNISPVSWLNLSSSVGLLNSSYGNYINGDNNLRNRQMPNSPNYQISLNSEIKVSNNFSFHTEYFQQDNFYFSNSHDQKGNGYQLVDTKLTWKDSKNQFDFFVENIFDQDFQTRGFFFGNQPPNYTPSLYTQRGKPRTVGTRFTHTF